MDWLWKRLLLWSWRSQQDVEHYYDKWVAGWGKKPSERRYWERKVERMKRRTKWLCTKAGHPLDFDDSREGMRGCPCGEVEEWRD